MLGVPADCERLVRGPQRPRECFIRLFGPVVVKSEVGST
jgi:hypothetical protein